MLDLTKTDRNLLTRAAMGDLVLRSKPGARITSTIYAALQLCTRGLLTKRMTMVRGLIGEVDYGFELTEAGRNAWRAVRK